MYTYRERESVRMTSLQVVRGVNRVKKRPKRFQQKTEAVLNKRPKWFQTKAFENGQALWAMPRCGVQAEAVYDSRDQSALKRGFTHPQGPRHSPTVGTYEGADSHE